MSPTTCAVLNYINGTFSDHRLKEILKNIPTVNVFIDHTIANKALDSNGSTCISLLTLSLNALGFKRVRDKETSSCIVFQSEYYNGTIIVNAGPLKKVTVRGRTSVAAILSEKIELDSDRRDVLGALHMSMLTLSKTYSLPENTPVILFIGNDNYYFSACS